MKEQKLSFKHQQHFEKDMSPIKTGGGRYCEGMNNAKKAKENADKLADYAKSHRPKQY